MSKMDNRLPDLLGDQPSADGARHGDLAGGDALADEIFADEIFADETPVDDVFNGEVERVSDDVERYLTTSARAVADTVRSTLGPRGMDKMLVDDIGTVTITNDGVTILRELQIENPTAKVVVDVAKVQEDEAGDGTTTSVVLVGELLKQAEELLERGVHPTSIIRGYNAALEEALERIDALADRGDPTDETLLRALAETSMTGKLAEQTKERLAQLAVDGVTAITVETDDGETLVDLWNLAVETQTGDAAAESELLNGAVLTRAAVHDDMPSDAENARVLLLDSPLEPETLETNIDSHIDVRDAGQLQAFRDRSETVLRATVDDLVNRGVNVILCQEEIAEPARHVLARNGVLAFQNVDAEMLTFVEDLLNATIVSDPSEADGDSLGRGRVRSDASHEPYVVERADGTASLTTILVKGSTDHTVAELERNVNDAIDVIAQVVRDGRTVPGGGAIEVELAGHLRRYAGGVTGREQLAVSAFGDALDVIPRTLAGNAGLDPIDTLVNLRTCHDRGERRAGVDVHSGGVVDVSSAGTLEPAYAKKQCLVSAVEAANTVLKIDEIIAVDDPFEDTDDEDFGITADDVPDEERGLGDRER